MSDCPSADFEADIISRGHKGERMMRGLKAIFSKAVEDEVIDMKLMPFKTGYNPIGYKFGHLKTIKKESSLIKRLSTDQVRKLIARQMVIMKCIKMIVHFFPVTIFMLLHHF